MKTLITPFFKFVLVIFIGILSINAQAESTDTAKDESLPCGMTMTADGVEVESGSFEICPNDISFQSLYILFGEILGDDAYRDLFLLFVDSSTLDSDFTSFADESLGVSFPIYLILSGVAVVGWTLLSPLIATKAWKVLHHFKKTGSVNFAESQGDGVKFIAYLSVLLMLVAPAGLSGGKDGSLPPLMLGQVLAITAGLPAIQSGNGIFSTYLAATNTASTEINLQEEFLLPKGQSTTNKLVETQMCENETRNALLSMNAKPDSEFFSNFSFTEYFDFDNENIVGRYDNCLSYVGKAEKGLFPDSISRFTLDKTNFMSSYCAGSLSYKPDAYGYAHTCGRIQYDYGQDKYATLIEGEESESGDDMEDVLETVQDAIDVADVYSRYKLIIKDSLKKILSDDAILAKDKYADIDELAMENAAIIEAQLAEIPSLSKGTNDERQAKYMAAGTALLGGSFTGSWTDGTGHLYEMAGNGLWKTKAYLPVNYEGESIQDIFGLDTLLSEARSIAEDIRSYYCAVHWADERETRKVIADYNMNADSADDLAAAIGSRSVSYRCIKFLTEDEEGETDFDRYVTYMVDDDKAFTDLVEIGDGDGYQFSSDSDGLIETQNYMAEDVASELYSDIQYKTFVLASYIASVQKALSDSLSSSLSTAEEEATNDLNLRELGWGVFGGALLYNGRTKGSAAHLGKTIEGLISVESGGKGLNFVESSAFGENLDQDKIDELYAPFELDNLLTVGFNSTGSYGGPTGIRSDDMKSKEMMEVFMGYLEQILFGPMDHIKSASGMEIDSSFSSGLQECFESGTNKCLTGAKHPLIALSDFGSELVDNMLTLMVTHGILKVVVNADLDQVINKSKGKLTGFSKSKGDSWWAKSKRYAGQLVDTVASVVSGLVKLLLNLIIKIMEMAYLVLDLFMPVIMILAIAGIIFAYLLPMLAYIYGFMMLLMFLVLIAAFCIVIPFYVFVKLLNIESEYKQGFMKLYQDFGSAYVTPVFFGLSAVVSWSLMVVLLYAVNTTFWILSMGLEASTASSSGLAVMFMKIFLYVVYYVALFVLFKFTLGILKTMPDMLREKINMKRANDEKYIESLGFEQYVAGQVGYQLTQTISSMPGKLAGALSDASISGNFKTTDALQREAQQAEATLANMQALHEKINAENGDTSMGGDNMGPDSAAAPATDNSEATSLPQDDQDEETPSDDTDTGPETPQDQQDDGEENSQNPDDYKK
ncbi:hypothetical protein [Alteromonas sp. 14N.309.X.WAT.G.H12]|uniref:hypothetical protein n=1 Tax=Alteromonas sp. 14N.309.X.WAT.G.H12 TaxID=3120824 RepID=UPI002FD439FA